MTEAMQRVRAAALEGDPAAQRALGSAYLRGDGVERDEAEGRAWLAVAAGHGAEPAPDAEGGPWAA